MAISVSTVATVPTNDHQLVFAEVTLDSSYPTGGEAVVPSDFGLQGIETVFVGSINAAKYHVGYTSAGRLIKVYIEDGTSGIEAEVADTTDLSAITVPVLVVGY